MTPPERRAKNDRFANFYLAASALVMVALIVVVVILVFHVSSVASADDRNAVTACNLANANRAEDVAIFHDILALPALASPQFITPANMARQRTAVAGIDADIKAAYAPRNCVALYSTKG
jgi:heme/copper-type cytochrome/quinol oxidase subunit 2